MNPLLEKIPFSAVSASIKTYDITGKEQEDYNTHHHSHSSISTFVPEFLHYKPESDIREPWILLRSWLDLISSSQGISPQDIHRIELPKIFLSSVLRASSVALVLGRLAASDEEDLNDFFPTTTTTDGTPLDTLLKDREYFLRLDTCSLKDAIIGQGPVKDIKDIWTRLATSARGTTGIVSMREVDKDAPIYMYLLPWRKTMDTRLEWRVFCAPPRSEISAISQYKWHEPWIHAAASAEEQNDVLKKVLAGVQTLYCNIMGHPAMTDQLRERGFSFDVLDNADDEKGGVQLIELNHSGAMSGCGSALFHWLKDARLLYGLSEEKEKGVQIRVAI